MNKKHIIIGLFFVLFATGNIFAQDTMLNMDFALPQTYDFTNHSQIDFMADGEAISAGPRLTSSPFLAGLSNTVFGLWSWMNKDWLGGGITAGLMVVGIGGSQIVARQRDPNMGMVGLLWASMVGGMVYGYVRGSGQCKKMNASNIAEAISDNPLNHISVAALPTFDERGVTGSLTYSVSF